jgi:regulator of protease activity HflC (stomatin/prohibitin superfamily)
LFPMNCGSNLGSNMLRVFISWIFIRSFRRGLMSCENQLRSLARSGAGRITAFMNRNQPHLVISALMLLFIVAILAPRIFVTIGSGEKGVLFRSIRGGTVTDRIYGEGLQVIYPWDTMHVYNTRVQEHHQPIEVLTRNGLTTKLEISIRYRPERQFLGVLHQNVGPDYLANIVIPEVISVLRTETGRLTAEELFGTERAILERVFAGSAKRVLPNFVEIEAVIIRKIEFPPLVKAAIEEKIEQQHLAESYEFRLSREQQEAKRKEIEALGHRVYNETVAPSLSEDILRWKGIEATREIATSKNAKVIVVGTGPNGLPIILGGDK